MITALFFEISKNTNDIIFTLSYFLLIIYVIALLMVFFYALAQLNLLFNYLGAIKKSKKGSDQLEDLYDLSNPEEVPFVTIQLPVFNEKYVMKRLLKNIAKLEYPREKLEIQVLDDSTDETVLQTQMYVQNLASKGLDIKHITRSNRQGFKAGALKEGLKIAKGELVVIFDSDFLPDTKWLYKTIPYFKNKKIKTQKNKN